MSSTLAYNCEIKLGMSWVFYLEEKFVPHDFLHLTSTCTHPYTILLSVTDRRMRLDCTSVLVTFLFVIIVVS